MVYCSQEMKQNSTGKYHAACISQKFKQTKSPRHAKVLFKISSSSYAYYTYFVRRPSILIEVANCVPSHIHQQLAKITIKGKYRTNYVVVFFHNGGQKIKKGGKTSIGITHLIFIFIKYDIWQIQKRFARQFYRSSCKMYNCTFFN